MAELRRAVYLSPYEAQAHLLIGRIHLRGGRPADAVDALKISIWSEDTRGRAARARRGLPQAAEYGRREDRTASARWRSTRRRPTPRRCSHRIERYAE